MEETHEESNNVSDDTDLNTYSFVMEPEKPLLNEDLSLGVESVNLCILLLLCCIHTQFDAIDENH